MDINFLSKTVLFKSLKNAEIEKVLESISYSVKKYSKNEIIFLLGDVINNLALVLSGQVNIIKEDAWGNKNIIANISKGGIFAEVYAIKKDEVLTVSAQANKDCIILFINADDIFNSDFDNSLKVKLIKNLLDITIDKNIHLNRKIDYITPKTIRERICIFLSDMAVKKGSYEFEINFNRKELADFLSVDRSALSNELSKMQKEGLLRFRKNKFTIIKNLDM